ncbi:helicase-related protein [Thiohalorhabdus methylotrophus]|uniref:Helicase-related protein n=1 Tax=Thiohalorhabdus methylotrophus TaxID=3242694 RepID=A0ABV4TYF5_9GAMM
MQALPIDKLRDEFDGALASGHVVVEAPTGSGKSTRLPLWCAEQGPVLMVEPRRMAARSLARHVAELRGCDLGEEVGYAVRFDARHGKDTRIVFVTPGVALRWLAAHGLDRFSSVVLDEFHERRWDTDLLAAQLKGAGRHRLVVTSATVAGQRLARYLGGMRLEAEGRTHPVDIAYNGEPSLPSTKNLEQRVANAVRRMLQETAEGDILVFLPGRGEIRAAEQALSGTDMEVIPLHAGVDTAIQDRALRTADHRRVILATNVAETSLTLPGVRVVVDSGLERRTHHRGGRTVLGLQAISQAAADQRAGRAGRLGPGRCLRLWAREARLEDYTPPEVAREELDDLLLAAAASGTPVTELEFPDPLPEHALERAWQRLRVMDAIDEAGYLTDHGRRLFPLPLDPLFAHLITAMPDADTRAAMTDLAAALSTDRPLLRPMRREEERQALLEWAPEPCDATTRIRLVRGDPPRAVPANRGALAEARRMADQIRQALDLPERNPDFPLPRESLLEAALAAAPELAYVRRAKRRSALGNGQAEIQPAEESRFPEEAEAALVFDQHSIPGKGTTRTLNLGTCMAPVSLETLARRDLGVVEHDDPAWDGETVTVTARRVYAERTIASESVEAEGPALRAALADLILSGKLLEGAGDRLREEIEAWNLYVALDFGEGEPLPEPREWLVERLQSLGVEQGSDLELVEVRDLEPRGIPEWERARFDRHYPRRLNLEGIDTVVHYEARRKRVTVEKVGGARTTVPRRTELPAWQGWKVQYRDGSRLVPVS